MAVLHVFNFQPVATLQGFAGATPSSASSTSVVVASWPPGAATSVFGTITLAMNA